jgi:hypothetical protein
MVDERFAGKDLEGRTHGIRVTQVTFRYICTLFKEYLNSMWLGIFEEDYFYKQTLLKTTFISPY